MKKDTSPSPFLLILHRVQNRNRQPIIMGLHKYLDLPPFLVCSRPPACWRRGKLAFMPRILIHFLHTSRTEHSHLLHAQVITKQHVLMGAVVCFENIFYSSTSRKDGIVGISISWIFLPYHKIHEISAKLELIMCPN